MGTILTVALLAGAFLFVVVSIGFFRAVGLPPTGPPPLWREQDERLLGKLAERGDMAAVRQVLRDYAEIATDINLHLEGEKPLSVSGVLFEDGRLVDQVRSLGTWVDEVRPDTVVRASPLRATDGRIVGVITLRMSGGPKHHDKFKPSLRKVWIGSTAIAALLLCLLTIRQGRKLSKQLGQFTVAATGVSRGELTRLDIPLVPKDLAELALAFNSMAEQLEERLLHLEEARTRAESADQMRRDFMAEIAHSLGTPLSAVQLGLAQLKQSDGGVPEIEEMEQKVDWLSLTTRRLVRLACWEIVEPEIRVASVSILDPVAHVLELLEERLLESDIEVELGRFLELRVGADEEALRTIFHALVENCIQHSGGSCLLTVWAQERLNGVVEVLVSDTGKGMSEETLARAQERYFTKGRTGLGLAIVKRLLDAHGTNLTIESEWGKGSLFRFTLGKGEKP